jgi:catechol 2,3-dioxygenase-like lactoylglutathione lyase family enzyme
MITKINNTSVFVRDQDEALAFYRDILGMEVRTDYVNGDYRWLTVGLKSQPDFELVLMPVQENHELSAETVQHLHAVLETKQMALGVLVSDDVMRDYETWSAQGVQFAGPPSKQPWGTSVRAYDPSGNWISILEPSGN